MQTVALVAPRRTPIAVRFIKLLPIALIVLCALAASSCPLWAQTLTVQIIDPPTDPYMFFAGDEQSFEAVACLDGVELDDGTVTWDWNFGDGSDDSTTNPTTHTYQDAGTFLVTVTATYNGLQNYATINADVAGGGNGGDGDGGGAGGGGIVGPGGAGDSRAVLSVDGANGGEVADWVNLWITPSVPAQGGVVETYQRVGDGDWVEEQGQGEWGWDNINHRWTRTLGTMSVHNHVPWSWQALVLMPGGEYAWTNTLTFSPHNTVVTSGTDIVKFTPGQDVTIAWDIDHKSGNAAGWDVTVEIHSLSGGTIKTLTKHQSDIGHGEIDWDGSLDGLMGGTATKGIYAYLVKATDSANPMCNDQDKATAPTMTIASREGQLFTYNLDVPSLSVEFCTPWEVDGAASGCTLTVYGPALGASKATVSLGDTASNPTLGYADPFFTIAPTEVGTFTAVLSAIQTPTAGAANRDGQAKPILQGGNALQIWPQALGVAWTQYVPYPFGTTVADMGATDTATNTHYNAYEGCATGLATRDNMRTAAVVLLQGHGNPWGIGTATDVNGIVSQTGANAPADDLYSIPLFPFSLNRALLIFFSGCDTWCNAQDTDPPADGLIMAAKAKGAGACAGFKGLIYDPMRDDFDAVFMSRMMSLGDDIATAYEWACTATTLDWLWMGNVQNFDCTDWGLKLKPARWGGQ